MGRSSARGGVEPLAALAAVFAVGAGLTLYATVIDDARLDADESDVPAEVLDELESQADADGRFRPAAVDPTAVAPPGWSLNVTLRTPARTFQWGPEAPNRTLRADRPVPVQLAPGRVETGRLLVEAWQ